MLSMFLLYIYIYISNFTLIKCYLVCVWLQIKRSVYFLIQLIFTTIHEFYCTFWYYSWVPLYYFS